MKTIAEQIKWDFETNGELEIRNKNGNRIYWENSNGRIIDNRPKSCESDEIVIEGVKYKLTKV